MHQFDYIKLKDSRRDSEMLSLVAQIHEHKGRQKLYIRQKPVELERLVEIAGYRDILNTIHKSCEFIPLKQEIILQLHRDLLSYTDKSFGGKFKNTQNYISETHADGMTFTRFTPLEPFETPQAVEAICTSYQQAFDRQVVDPLTLIPVFICGFLCIHPFIDGNGRMSRLLTTLLLYKSGCMIGKYISIEKKIEKTKDNYYDVLGQISAGWQDGVNDYTPFIKYFLSIILNCCKDFENRIGSVDRRSTAYVRNPDYQQQLFMDL